MLMQILDHLGDHTAVRLQGSVMSQIQSAALYLHRVLEDGAEPV